MKPSKDKIAQIEEFAPMIIGYIELVLSYSSKNPSRTHKRELIESCFIVSLIRKIHPAVNDESPEQLDKEFQDSLESLHRILLLRVLHCHCSFRSSTLKKKLNDLLEKGAYDDMFNIVGELFVCLMYSENQDLEDILLTGLLIDIIHPSKPCINKLNGEVDLIISTDKKFAASQIITINSTPEREMELDRTNLNVRDWLMKELRKIDSDMSVYSEHQWTKSAISKLNVLIHVACLVYMRRGSSMEFVADIARGIHPEMIYIHI